MPTGGRRVNDTQPEQCILVQGDAGVIKKIDWIVLKEDGDSRLIISKYILDKKAYSDCREAADWNTSSIRNWLNNEFINEAFTKTEQEKIRMAVIKNESGTAESKDTADKVFMLSREEAGSFLYDNNERLCAPTEYAMPDMMVIPSENGASNACWWLRSPGKNKNSACCVRFDGNINFIGDRGADVKRTNIGVRPVRWIRN